MSHIVSRKNSVFLKFITNFKNNGYSTNVRSYVCDGTVTIGTVTKEVKKVKRPEYVPRNYYQADISQNMLHHLRWMMQKDIIGQDLFLIGPPGPRRRNLAMQYLELTNREHEYIALSRDTTESDLKQRREIVAGTAKYFDQSAVRAATEGRILILEGIEKVERNVLPILNNLLENREMHLEDGRLLISSNRYDELSKKYTKEELDNWKLVRVDENFRVIALGLPVPRYRGNPLDPPLRSRFQGRDISNDSFQDWLRKLNKLCPSIENKKLSIILSASFALLSKECNSLGLPDFPIDNLPLICMILEKEPKLSPYNLLYRMYPYRSFLKNNINSVESLLLKLGIIPEDIKHSIDSVQHNVNFDYIPTNYQNKLIDEMCQTLEYADFCLIGSKGCGKSLLISKVAQKCNKEIEPIVLYQDMTARDIIQQRVTLENGDTKWKFSPLVEAALNGKIAVLDGIHRIHPSTLSVLHRLVHDRELQLYDDTRLISEERYLLLQEKFGLTENQLSNSGILKIHPNFKIIAIGEPPLLTTPTGNWLTAEMLSLFLFHEMRPLTKEEEMHIIVSKFGPIGKPLHQIIDLAHILRNNSDLTLKNLSGHLSTRQLIRIAEKMKLYPTTNVYDTVEDVFMHKFLPPLTRQALENILTKLKIVPSKDDQTVDHIKYSISDNILTIGKTTSPVHKNNSLAKVPHVVFYDVPQHLKLMEKLLQDFHLKRHLLIVGNQGVGKNKIIDRFLELLNRPREYIQLHRDTTVQTLTIQPTIKNGLLIFEDSPLVKAIKSGNILVIDEADKAPTHVTCILKTLVETGQMILSDGRRIVKSLPQPSENINLSNYIQTHPDFRIIILANRPGFPFLGNDFFGALGDLFSCHAVDNPTKSSEIELLKQYGPNVPIKIINTLVDIFGELRTMADEGLVNYPYSTREVVNIVKHLEKYPNSDLEEVIFNVFDFDRYSPEIVDILGQILEKHGFSKDNILSIEYKQRKRAKEYLQVTENRVSGLDTSTPKHGKEDPKNDPHVGGNTWAGGTGGRDTAGLGGKGGPYRLDKGHKVFQLSDEEKNAVPEHIKKAAKEMGRKAFQEKLNEIKMSGYDAAVYAEFSNSVSRQVQSLRGILSSLHAKNKERYWSRHQTSGELDDVKLIDGLLGEKTIFRKRTEQEPEMGTPQYKPKLFRVVVDVSGSMYRFNSYDGRLNRQLEAVVLVMEAFEGFQDKILYDIKGHSGDEHDIEFVNRNNPPKNNKERLDIIRTMVTHSQYCWTGDNTLPATELAVTTLAAEECDEAIVIVLSDANLQRYGIPPSHFAKILTSCPNVNSYAIFIGGLGNQAEKITENLPPGRSFICIDLEKLPQILKQIFSSSVMKLQ